MNDTPRTIGNGRRERQLARIKQIIVHALIVPVNIEATLVRRNPNLHFFVHAFQISEHGGPRSDGTPGTQHCFVVFHVLACSNGPLRQPVLRGLILVFFKDLQLYLIHI